MERRGVQSVEETMEVTDVGEKKKGKKYQQ
jgi:hypothetical protein